MDYNLISFFTLYKKEVQRFTKIPLQTIAAPAATSLLFLIIFFWTPSHFWALSLYKKEDYKKADITNIEKAMLDYSYKLTLFPWDMTKTDVEDLKKVGFSDREILDINQIVSYYAYVNRLADGLGVELENI